MLDLRSCSPAPARIGEALALSFDLPRADRAWTELYDLAGRIVATSEASALPAGIATVRWHPEITQPGCYFVRVRTLSGLTASRRIALLR